MGEVVLRIVIAAIVVCIAYFLGKRAEYVAAEKGYGKEAYAFPIGFLFGFFGWIYVAALPDKIQEEQNLKIIKLLKQIVNGKNQNME